MRIETRALYMLLGLAFGALVVLFTSGCYYTLDGVGALMEGIGHDTRDIAQGSRNKMAERADR